MDDVTQILWQIERGDPAASRDLLPLVYDELRKLARQRLAQEPPGQTLPATALVHEAYLRLVGPQAQSWNSRGHFFAAAAIAMRRILVETARRKLAARYGGGFKRVDAELDRLPQGFKAEEILNIDHELERLRAEHPVVAKLVELKYFAGFTLEEVSGELGVTVRTAYRYWAFAKAWLRQAIEDRNSAS